MHYRSDLPMDMGVVQGLEQQIRKDLQDLRDRGGLGVSEEAYEWLVGEVVADVAAGKYEWVEKKGGKRGKKTSVGA